MLAAGLSVRKPRKTACLRRPSRVHCANETSATNVGLTQCALPSIVSDSANGVVARATASSLVLIVRSDVSLKPLPTLPT